MKTKPTFIYTAKVLLGLGLSTLAHLSLSAHAGTPGVEPSETALHKVRMDDSQDLKEDLREALDKKDVTGASEISRKLAALARLEEDYWQRTRIEPAIALAQQSVIAANRMNAAAQSTPTAETQQAFTNVEQNCRTCHDLHPEKQRDLKPER